MSVAVERLVAAAEAARRASSVTATRDTRTVTITLTEDGFVIVGESGLDGFGMKWRAVRVVTYQDAALGIPDVLTNAVHLVVYELDKAEGVR